MKITEYVEIRTVPIDLSVIDQVLWGCVLVVVGVVIVLVCQALRGG